MWETIQILTNRVDYLERLIQKPKSKIADDNSDTKSQDASDYLLQAETYLYIGCSLTTLKSWKNKGVIPFYRKKGRIYFKKSEIDKNKVIQRYRDIYK